MMFDKKLRILLYGSNIWFLGEGMLGPIIGVFTQKIGGNILDISWIWATYLIVTGTLTILFGKISDTKISKEKLLVAGYALNTVFTFAYLGATSPIRLFLVQVGLGTAAALATPTWDALYAREQDRARAGYIWGLADGQANCITGIAVIAGGLILNYFSFNVLFIIMGGIQTLATIYQAQVLWAGRTTSTIESDADDEQAIVDQRQTSGRQHGWRAANHRSFYPARARHSAYPSDVNDDEWAFIVPYLATLTDAAEHNYTLREMFNGLRWSVRAGAAWQMLPDDLPPWHIVSHYAQRWLSADVFDAIADDLRVLLAALEDRVLLHPPLLDAAAALDSTEPHARLDDVDVGRFSDYHYDSAWTTLGQLLLALESRANTQDHAYVKTLPAQIEHATGEAVEVLFGSRRYTSRKARKHAINLRLEAVKLPDSSGFVCLPQRWVVEPKFAWLARCRRLARDYERLPATLAALQLLHDSEAPPLHERPGRTSITYSKTITATFDDFVFEGPLP